MKINCGNFKPLEQFTNIDAEKFCSLVEKIAQSKVDELTIIPKDTAETSFALTFLTAAEMQKINMQYRQVDAATDVLSFPIWENENGLFTPPSDWQELPLGDILVCPEFVNKNAKDNGKCFEQELALVIFHGLLHLCGYDHDTEERRIEMWKQQDEMVFKFMEILNND